MISPDLYSFQALWRHYRQCRHNKRNTANALAFEVNAEAHLLGLPQVLRTHTYRPGRSICFITDGPKPREVFAADFRDRVVHHLLVSHQERVFEPRFIPDSYACRQGKGTLAASDRLMTFLRQVTANGQRPAWALKLDVANFFPSIHKATLYAIIARHLKHPEILWLTRTLLFHDPTTRYRFQSRNRRVPGPESPTAAQALGLHTVALPRAGYAFTVGFPARLSGLYATRAIRQELIVVEVRQAPVLLGRGCVPRLPCTVVIPTPVRHSEVLGLV